MRLRFAPSPTGALHIGGARTALFNWLLARQSGGSLLLRIEDTDIERSSAENVEQILDALSWLEIQFDEGPVMQSSRRGRHVEVLRRLLSEGRAYHCTATAAEVAAYKREHGQERGFRGVESAEGAVRLRVSDSGKTVVNDLIRGPTRFAHVHLDDPVIARADGSVLYNFAVAVDDLDAAITHVVRGEDHLPNTPKQLLVLEALGAEPPIYAHLPLLHGPDGRKLSKRHGAASVQDLRDAGYLPEAVRNYLALLGWGSGSEETILSTEQLITRFDITRVSRNPARFDPVKMRWMNGVYIRSAAVDALAEAILKHLDSIDGEAAAAVRADPRRFAKAVAISQEKLHTLADFWPLAGFLFLRRPTDPKASRRWLDADGRLRLAETRHRLEDIGQFDEQAVRHALEGLVLELGCRPGEVYQPLRVAIAGVTVSPGIFESVALLGREETLKRVDAALEASLSAST